MTDEPNCHMTDEARQFADWVHTDNEEAALSWIANNNGPTVASVIAESFGHHEATLYSHEVALFIFNMYGM